MNTAEFLKAITEASGPSGYEDDIRIIVKEAFAPYCDESRQDAMGNVWNIKHGKKGQRRIMLAGHMDEIGLIVSKIDGAVLRFTQVGGFDVRILPGQPVLVHGKQPLPGIIGIRPPHLVSAEERDTVIPMDKLFIDVGLTAETLGQSVRVGDLVTLRRNYIDLKNGLAASKAMDDRAGVAVLFECLQCLSTISHDWDVYAVATVQEELGLRGAATSSFGIAPDAAIATDVTFAHTPDMPEIGTCELDKGPSLAKGPNIHPVVYQRLEDIAKRFEIPYQIDAIPGRSGTDAWAIQMAREGVPTGLLEIPLRYMHTPNETLAIRDVERGGRLMAYFIASLDDEFINALSPALPEE